MRARAFAGGLAIGFGLSFAAWMELMPRAVLDGGMVALAIVFAGHLIFRIVQWLGGPER
jgi:hypothetical protein